MKKTVISIFLLFSILIATLMACSKNGESRVNSSPSGVSEKLVK